jgi:ABC-type nickel/cobalt efflux system permease component RcnA
MPNQSASLFVLTVAVVGVLHTLAPDHWAPIVVVARQRGWSILRTARAAGLAGLGHVVMTLLLGVLLWLVGATLAVRYAHMVSVAAAVALLVFGLWIAYGGWKEAREDRNDDGREHSRGGHAHPHQHQDGLTHAHWHEHHQDAWDSHVGSGGAIVLHAHEHPMAGRTALLLILGSSPMFEGIPAFLAASTRGPALLGIMTGAFALTTIATYIVMCSIGLRGLQRASLGPLERYGEVISGLFVAAVGIYALVTSL